MERLLVDILNGLTMSMLLFLVSVGFSITFGLMNVVNMAHGGFFMLGAYISIMVVRFSGKFEVGLLAGAIATGVMGIFVRRGLLQRHAKEALSQLLLTIGLLFIFGDTALWIWGGYPLMMTNKPWGLEGSTKIGDLLFPKYRLFVILLGFVLAIIFWFLQERTRWGTIVRAGVDDEQMCRGIGIDIPLVTGLVFGLGSLLAGLAGVIAAPLMGAYPGLDLEVLTLSMAVVIIGGKGSLVGSFVGALLVGMADSIGPVYFPELKYFLIFGLVAILLVVRPSGLFGTE